MTAARAVSFAVPTALHPWNATTVVHAGMGASEEMIVYLARALARQGAAVGVYAPVPFDEIHEGVWYKPREEAGRAKRGPVVVSRAPLAGTYLDGFIGRPLDKILWLQDAKYDDLKASEASYRKIVVVSHFHRELMVMQHGVDASRFEVIYNFLLAEHFARPPKRVKHRFIYCSSPERGLPRLLEMWPKIRERFPAAELHVFYGWANAKVLGESADPAWNALYQKTLAAWDAMGSQPGIVDHGRVDHATLARELMMADAWLYPCRYVETCCLTALKARAASCVPVTTPYGALKETAASCATQFVDHHLEGEAFETAFLAAVERAVETPEAARQAMREEALDLYSLDAILPQWKELLWR